MNCFERPWPVICLYISGMFFAIFGVVSLIISIDPRPFDSDSWTSFLYVGILFLVAGGIILILTVRFPEMASGAYGLGETDRITYDSAVDLLDDVQSVGCADSPIVKLREAALRTAEASARTVKSCMMTQSSLAGSEGILFYKETVV